MTTQRELKKDLDDLVAAKPEVLDLFDSFATDGLWFRDPENPDYEWASPAFWRLLGYEREAIPQGADAWKSVIHPDDYDLVALAKDHPDVDKPYDQLIRFKHKDGRTVWVRRRGFTVRDAERPTPRMLGCQFDVTDYIKAISAAENAESWHEIFDAAPYAIIRVSDQGKIQQVNRAAMQIFGYRQEELIGEAVEILVPGRDRHNHPNNRTNYMQKLEIRAMGRGRDLFGLHKDGTEIPVEISLHPVRSRAGISVVASIVDITERKQVQDALIKTNEEMEQFAYIASHDLKSPLRAIENLASWIIKDTEGILPEKSYDDLNLLIGRVERMKNLLDSLLTFSRIGRVDQAFSEFETRAMLEEALQLQNPPETFTIALKGDFPRINGPYGAMLHTVTNLIDNAIKHHDKPSGTLEITCGRRNDYLAISVRDDGPGIDAQYHESIFKMFHTLKPRDEIEGSGMGLAMIKKTVDVYNGKVELFSSLGAGATFVVYWPLNAPHDLETGAAARG